MLAIITLGMFIYDIQRRARTHFHAIWREKSKIATDTEMNATMGTFADGRKTTALIAVSESSALFYYRLFLNERIIRSYTLALPNINAIELVIDGRTHEFDIISNQNVFANRATEISTQACEKYFSNKYMLIHEIALMLRFNDGRGEEKQLPIRLFRDPKPAARKLLPKTLENAIWWQQYLRMCVAAAAAAPLSPKALAPSDEE